VAKIQHQFKVAAPATKVFQALCTPDGLNSWWTLQAAGRPQKGEVYTFFFGPEYDWRAVVASASRNRSLTWKMTQAKADWMPTQVGFTLNEKDGATTVHFFHSGWKKANEHFAITNFCWGQLLQGLKDYVETGAIVPFENRN
jgi:uncharacterized protein YndB with AHSA1/START domain